MIKTRKSIVVFGSHLCKDCVVLKAKLEEENINFRYLDITENLGYMKMFLKYRDEHEMFKEAKEEGKIGIPFIVVNRGEKLIFTESEIDLEELR